MTFVRTSEFFCRIWSIKWGKANTANIKGCPTLPRCSTAYLFSEHIQYSFFYKPLIFIMRNISRELRANKYNKQTSQITSLNHEDTRVIIKVHPFQKLANLSWKKCNGICEVTLNVLLSTVTCLDHVFKERNCDLCVPRGYLLNLWKKN